MKKKDVLFIVCLIPILFSCGGGKSSQLTIDDCPVIAQKVDHNGSEITLCDQSLAKDTFDMPLTSILSSFEVVQLDNTSDEALIGNDSKVTISDNYIGIYSSHGGGYKLFDKKGKFLRTISAKGQGTNEYVSSIYDHYIDEANNRIYLLSYRANKLLVFDLEGNPQQHIPFPFTVHKGRIRVDYQKQELLVMALPFIETPYVVWKQDFQGNIIQKIDAGHFVIDPGDYSNEVNCSWNTGELDFSLGCWLPREDFLYHYDEAKNRLNPTFSMKFGDKIPRYAYQELPGYYIIDLVVPASPTFAPRSPQVLVDKQTLRGGFVRWKYDLLGDIDGPNWALISRGYFIANMFPHELKDQLSKALSRPETLTEEVRECIQKLNNNITDDDNNIIIYGKLKRT